MRIYYWLCVGITFFILLFSTELLAADREKGIYLTQNTIENRAHVAYLVNRAKAAGITTFVIDFNKMTNAYRENINLVKDNHLKYVARIVFFPGGGTRDQVLSESYWETKFALAKQAISIGADEIQLDYIRYKPSQRPSEQNAKDIYHIVRWFKQRLDAMNIPLQIDVFGIATFGESRYIGQDLRLLGQTIDTMCPMLYPSHFVPFGYHGAHPYQTVYNSLLALHTQLDNQIPFRIVPYIELRNYHFWHPEPEILGYIYAQIKATQDANTDGWYAWSPGNLYENLFRVMKIYPVT